MGGEWCQMVDFGIIAFCYQRGSYSTICFVNMEAEIAQSV